MIAVGLIGACLAAACLDEAAPLFRYSNKKVGGLRFIRIGRLSLSFCITK